ncbi:MAG: hypothetical protein Q8O08_01330 [Methyloversatilis sp.]|uniref:hypothetical protein n=1 Tax=Methyloversatilis sp. TaxID=2569862 RepID=UPI0027334FA3|nr:hypothetical protein [Methyloversatilis sp.]MDP2867438.1 hypothetical protein [Methyloversatilis sp.]
MEDDPSAGHSAMCKALWKALSGSGQEAWRVLDASGFNSALVEAVSGTFPGVAIERTPAGFYRLCALPTVPAYEVLSHMQAALAGWKSAAEALRHLAEPARNTVLRMCMAAVERCIQEGSAQPNLGEETLATGLPIAVDTATSAYLIAAAWLGYSVRLEFKDGQTRAAGCLDTPGAPVEYGHLGRVEQIKAGIMALDPAWSSMQPRKPGEAKPLPTERYVKKVLIPRLKGQGLDLILAVSVADNQHHLADPQVCGQVYRQFGLVTVRYGREPNAEGELDDLVNDLQLMIANMHLDLNPQSDKSPEKEMKHETTGQNPAPQYHFHAPVGKVGDGNGDQLVQANAPGAQAAAGNIVNHAPTAEFTALLDAFLTLARETPELQARPESLQYIEAQVREVKEAVAAPEPGPQTGKWLKAALDGMEMATKGLDNGAKLLEKLAPVKDWLLAYINSL